MVRQNIEVQMLKSSWQTVSVFFFSQQACVVNMKGKQTLTSENLEQVEHLVKLNIWGSMSKHSWSTQHQLSVFVFWRSQTAGKLNNRRVFSEIVFAQDLGWREPGCTVSLGWYLRLKFWQISISRLTWLSSNLSIPKSHLGQMMWFVGICFLGGISIVHFMAHVTKFWAKGHGQ